MTSQMIDFEDDTPVWVLETQLEEPLTEVRKEIYTELFCLPHGMVFALLAYVFDDPDRPLVFHRALDLGEEEGRRFFDLYCRGALKVVYLARSDDLGDIQTITAAPDKLRQLVARRDAYQSTRGRQQPGAGVAQYRALAEEALDSRSYGRAWEMVEPHCVDQGEDLRNSSDSTAPLAARETGTATRRDAPDTTEGYGLPLLMVGLGIPVPVAMAALDAYLYWGSVRDYLEISLPLFIWLSFCSALLAVGLSILFLRALAQLARTAREVRHQPVAIRAIKEKPALVRTNARRRLLMTTAGTLGFAALWLLSSLAGLSLNEVLSDGFSMSSIKFKNIIGGFVLMIFLLIGGFAGSVFAFQDDKGVT